MRWRFVYQRPQHLIGRFAKNLGQSGRRVFFWEEPVFGDSQATLERWLCPETGVLVLTPRLPSGGSEQEIHSILRELLDEFLSADQVTNYALWFYTPMALAFAHHLKPQLTVYDCMDELSLFKGAPPALREREDHLFARADLVFTGGQSLYEAKRTQHPDVHAFPSSVDVAHFEQARNAQEDPADQASIPHPRIGYCGVIDERIDLELIAGVAAARPDWHLVMIGPVVKIDPASLPRAGNIHYLGGKDYKELPRYFSGWDVAMIAVRAE